MHTPGTGGKTSNIDPVKRTSVTLPDDLAELLAEEAHRQRVSVSGLVREAVVLRLALVAMMRDDLTAAEALDRLAGRA